MILQLFFSERLDAIHVCDAAAHRYGTLQFSEEANQWRRVYGRGFQILVHPYGAWDTLSEAILALLSKQGLNFEWLVEDGEDRWLAGVGERPEPDAVAEGADTGAPASESSAPPLLGRLSPAAPATSSTGSPLRKLSKKKKQAALVRAIHAPTGVQRRIHG